MVPDGAHHCPSCKLFVGAQNRVYIAPKVAGITTPAQKIAAWTIVTVCLISFTLILAIVVAANRNPAVTESGYDSRRVHSVSVGMSEDEVIEIEGMPRRIELEYPYPGSKETYDVWFYKQFSVHFHKGKATLIELH